MKLSAFFLWLTLGWALAGDRVESLIPQPKSVVRLDGSVALTTGSRVLCRHDSLRGVAGTFAEDVRRAFGIELPVVTGDGEARPGDLTVALLAGGKAGHYELSVGPGDAAVLQATDAPAAGCALVTLLQLIDRGDGGLRVPRVTVLDHADRSFRALQVSVRGGYHAPQWVCRVIDAARLFHIRIVQLHTTESLWVGSTLASSDRASPDFLRGHAAWSRREMEMVLDYAVQRGVSLLPHNEMRPNDPFWKAALEEDPDPADQLAGYMDEVDGMGAFKVGEKLGEDARFWAFLREVVRRSCGQFARTWPGGKLPYYHIGPVYGEGGCSGRDAVRMHGILKEWDPGVRMMYWNGPADNDPDLGPLRSDVAVAFYSAHWGGTPGGQLAAGFGLVNVSWRPLYVQPGTRRKAQRQARWIAEQFHVARFGDEGPFGAAIAARDLTPRQDAILGAMLASWDFGSADQEEGHLEMLLPCLPVFGERIWNVRPWPYADSDEVMRRAAAQQALLHSLVREPAAPSVPGDVTATQGVHPDAVDVLWGDSRNFPESYKVFRGSTSDPAGAVPISPLLPASDVTKLHSFRDTDAPSGAKRFYFVKAVSAAGESAFSAAAEGWSGAGVAVPEAEESFDYPAGTRVDGLAGGSGFSGAWKVVEENAPLVMAAEGLSYPGLKSAGRALRVAADDADETNRRRPPHVKIERPLAEPFGRDGTEVWSSFLVRAERDPAIGDLHCNLMRTNVGKGWGRGFGIYTSQAGIEMEPNRTYLLVVRTVFHRGHDLMHLWVNPPAGRQPTVADANVVSRAFDNPEDRTVVIGMQPYGKGAYLIDEFRCGPHWQGVLPASP